MEEFNIEKTFQEIKATKSEDFKELVTEKMNMKALEYLNSKKENMSKMKDIKYNELKLQEYFTWPDLSTKHKKLLYMLRCRMINVGHNYGRKVTCPLGCKNDDRQQHITHCNVIKQSCIDVMMHDIDIDVIYTSQDKEKISTAVKVFEGAFRTRQELLEERQ